MVISADVQIKTTIQEGSVFYYSDDEFGVKEPHYFIVLNFKPKTDNVLILVCATTMTRRAIERRSNCPKETLVDITESNCSFIKHPTLVDCNSPFNRTVEMLIEKLEDKKLRLEGRVDEQLVEKLRRGVIASPLVENRLKKILESN